MPIKHTKTQFKILIERDEDGFFVGSVPALPGCHTQAKTLPELFTRIKNAIKLCLQVSRKNPKYRSKIEQFAYEPSFIGLETVNL